MWKKIGIKTGTMVEGDKSSPPTRWWNKYWLVLFGWKVVATFRVPKDIAAAGYYVGYTPIKGSTWYNDSATHGEVYSMKIGHEDCEFFVLPVDQKSPPIKPELIARGPLH